MGQSSLGSKLSVMVLMMLSMQAGLSSCRDSDNGQDAGLNFDGGIDGDAGADAGFDAGDDSSGDTGSDTGLDAGADEGLDAGSDAEAGDDSGGDSDNFSPWLHTAENHIYQGDHIWHGKGANIHDTRSCWACSASAPDVGEVKRRLDELIDVWGANFVRLDLESYATQESWMVQWQGVLNDPEYYEDIVEIIDYIGTKNGVYVMLSLWVDPSFTDLGWPSSDTASIWESLAATFHDDPQLIFGLVNEPESNFDGAQDEAAWTAMNNTVEAIRSVEASFGQRRHIIAVQGLGAWARRLDYYVDHQITAGQGRNIAYEIHIYDPASRFNDMLVGPAESLPVIIGEFGPSDVGGMTEADCSELITLAKSLEIPHLAWTFHMRCPPNLLVDNSGGGCGVDMGLEPTSWGTLIKNHLGEAW